MDTKTENGRLTQKIPNTNLTRVLEGGIETLTCASKEGITEKDILGYFAWLEEQPNKVYKRQPTPEFDRIAEEEALKMKEFLKEHPVPFDLLASRD